VLRQFSIQRPCVCRRHHAPCRRPSVAPRGDFEAARGVGAVGLFGPVGRVPGCRVTRRPVLARTRALQGVVAAEDPPSPRPSVVWLRRASRGLQRTQPTLSRTLSVPVPFVSIGLPALPAAASAPPAEAVLQALRAGAGGCHSWVILLSSVCSVCSVDCLLLSAFRSLLFAFRGMFQTSRHVSVSPRC
jgi:hypothetical protein